MTKADAAALSAKRDAISKQMSCEIESRHSRERRSSRKPTTRFWSNNTQQSTIIEFRRISVAFSAIARLRESCVIPIRLPRPAAQGVRSQHPRAVGHCGSSPVMTVTVCVLRMRNSEHQNNTCTVR